MAYTSEIEKLERRVQENPQGRFFASLADAYRKDGQIARALEVVKAGLVIHPDYVSARVVLGRCYMDQGDDAAAQEAFTRVAELDGESVIALKALAEIAERQGDFGAAAKWAQQLLTVDPGSEEARDQLARVEARSVAPDPAPAAADPPVAFLDLGEPALPAAEEQSEPAVPAIEPEVPAEPAPTLELSAAPRRDAIRFEPSSETEPRTLELIPPEPEPQRPSKRLSEVELTSMDAGTPESEAVAPARGLETTAPMEAISDLAVDGLEATAFDGGMEPPAAGDAGVREEPAREVAEPEPLEREEDFDLTPGDASEYQQPDASASLVPGGGSAEYQTPSAVDGLTLVDEPDEASPGHGVPEPEPVVTEAMAVLYASQGHLREALSVYRELLDRAPADSRLAAKVAELEGAAAPASPQGWRAAETGGRSVGSWLTAVTGARLPDVAMPAGSSPEVSEVPTEPTAALTAVPDDAPSGAPTRPARDSMSLSSIFGDEPAAPPTSGAAAGSFDDFFGAPPSATAAPAAPRPRSIRQAQPDDDDLSQFQDWLKNLKK